MRVRSRWVRGSKLSKEVIYFSAARNFAVKRILMNFESKKEVLG